MFIAIKKLEDNTIFIDKYLFIEKPEEDRIFTDEQLSQSPYNYTKVEVPDEYKDCEAVDFNDDLTFSVEKYNLRKLYEQNVLRETFIVERLTQLSNDFVQVSVGAQIDNLNDRILEFRSLHNELRALKGKAPRLYK